MCITVKSELLPGEAGIVKRHGEVGAVATKPCGVSRLHHHFSNPPAATRRNSCASCSGLRPETPRKGQGTMPRPKRAQGVTSEIHIRVTSNEKDILHTQAEKAGLTVSEYLRRCSLNKRLHSRVSDKAVARLSSLCGLQKHLLTQITGLPQEGTLRSELNSVLAGITATLRSIVKNDEGSE